MNQDSGGRPWLTNRRQVLAAISAMGALAGCTINEEEADEYQYGFDNGLKIGQVTAESANVWTRLTRRRKVPQRSRDYWYPPAPGTIQLAAWPSGQPGELAAFEQRTVTRDSDAAATFELRELDPGTEYELLFVGAPADGEEGVTLEGEFRTAPDPAEPAEISFAVVSCQAWRFRDAGDQGFRAYETLSELAPSFFVHTGDIIYLDQGDLRGRDPETARRHWRRTYSLPLLTEFHNTTPSYFLKDDHDIGDNDCWPGTRYGNLRFAEGVDIFHEHNPSGEVPYSTARWGSDLQIWLPEMREFRSANTMPDGPEKSILGERQRRWLMETIERSDATFRVVVSPLIVVGPDEEGKGDSHANRSFRWEGQRLREFFADQDVVVIGGDRHWQYVSVDPDTGLWEFSCGALAKGREDGWRSDDRRPEHRFLAVAPGFVWATVSREDGEPILTIEHRDRHGGVRHTEQFTADPLEAR